jgi:hypothetical protein
MSHELIRVCKEHQDFFSIDCAVCKLEFARDEMVATFCYVTLCCKPPYFGGPVARLRQPP